ncbi:MAG TPA: hypothetical protein VMM17_05760, partial [Gemmatimonadaceae bacterium]|nr:hypothetical protein [Gemmatimonadaceae bacterium]
MVSILAVLVLGGMMSVLVRQQRFYSGTADLLEARSQTRQAAGILPTELRAISPVGGDILAMSDTALEFRATVGSSVLCAISGGQVVLPPTNPSRGNVASTWGAPPAAGDTVLIFNEGPTTSAMDDGWTEYEIASTTAETGSCPESSGLTTAADANNPNLKFAVDGGLSPDIRPGSPMRFLRRARYSLYAAPNGYWYLGYCSPTCGAGGPDPIAGPFMPASDAASGIRFSYFDVNGAVTATPSAVAQVSVLVRADSR